MMVIPSSFISLESPYSSKKATVVPGEDEIFEYSAKRTLELHIADSAA
ncbi:MAG TPA: hypothetical protein VGM92_00535 [Candidatus Kapabacteria bacterium]|jgi:hypothetical protein